MAKCYAFQGTGSDNNQYVYLACTDNPQWIPNPQSPGGSYYSPASNGSPLIAFGSWWTTAGGIVLCRNEAEVATATAKRGVGGACSGCFEDPSIKYDCINAACTKSTQYKTPGIYQSLSQCETACGTGCSGQCIPNDEWNKIQSLANQLKNKNCS